MHAAEKQCCPPSPRRRWRCDRSSYKFKRNLFSRIRDSQMHYLTGPETTTRPSHHRLGFVWSRTTPGWASPTIYLQTPNELVAPPFAPACSADGGGAGYSRSGCARRQAVRSTLWAVRTASPSHSQQLSLSLPLSSVERYDPATNVWEPVAAMASVRSRPGVALCCSPPLRWFPHGAWRRRVSLSLTVLCVAKRRGAGC